MFQPAYHLAAVCLVPSLWCLQVQFVTREVRLLREVDHPAAVKLHEALQSPSEVFLVMGIAGRQDLLQEVLQRGRLSEPEAMGVAHQLLHFVEYMQREKCAMHRDLKPDNVMVTANPDGSLRATVVDFGFATVVGPPKSLGPATIVGTPCGTRGWCAPEVLAAGVL